MQRWRFIIFSPREKAQKNNRSKKLKKKIGLYIDRTFMKEEVEREKAGGNPSRKTKTGLRNSMGKRMIKSHHPRPTWDQWDLAPLSSSSMRALSFTSPPLLATPSTSYPAHCHHTYACRGVCVGLCACACAHNTHMHTHTHLSTPDFVVKALGIFKRNQCVFVVVAASKFLITGTSKEPAIHCLYSILGAKNFWKHFRRFPKFILSWNLSSDS